MTANTPAPTTPSEAGVLAAELAASFGRLVQWYEKHHKLPHAEARERAAETEGDGGERILNAPPDQVQWFELEQIARTDPDRALARWEEIKRAALDELQTGHRAARAIEAGIGETWQRVQFLAIRDDLAAEWLPRNGIERQLIDTMAQAQTEYLRWLHILTSRTVLSSIRDRKEDAESRWQAPRQLDADAIYQAAEMMDRFNRIFLRTLRALRDMRRHPILVQNAGQVNVGGQQINVSCP